MESGERRAESGMVNNVWCRVENVKWSEVSGECREARSEWREEVEIEE